MAGLSREPDCEALRREITESLMLRLPLGRRPARHLTACAACAADAEATRQVVAAFEAAGPGAPGGAARPVPSADLGDLVLREVRGARSVQRVTALLAAVFVTACALGTASLLARPGPAGASAGSAAPVVSVTRTGPMVAAPWGTGIPLALTGLRPGRVYVVLARDAAGHRAPAGSVRCGAVPAATVRVEVVTAMGRDAVVAVLVEDDRGRPVAEADVTAPRPARPA